MALPSLNSLEECSDFNKTVVPFIPQLYALPERLLAAVTQQGGENGGLTGLYVETNPLISGFAISTFLGAVFLVAAEVNRNYSQVDRFWSLLPTFYIAHFDLWARLAGAPAQRLDIALLFSTLWSIRLTYNYWRKGGYEIGSEDYRWAIIRSKVPAFVFHVFNWTFISFIQSILLFVLAAPVYVILLATQFEPDVTFTDIGFLGVQIGLIVIEIFADQQQWNYQTAKQQYKQSSKTPAGFKQVDLDRGFITSGLWAYSRHPNFAAEQTIWIVLYQWGCFGSKVMYNWTGAGVIGLLGIFQGSTGLTEAITGGKYPEYKDYQKAVGTFVPTSLQGYQPPPPGAGKAQPKVIRTSELEKKLAKKKK